ncbi:sensor histidine kinase [Pantanalinema sp. GBBB05]|uniref:sensor histidine kinase n=1 Tax=Pantanalinema sp. GBBB05 TaxID=2604139 RepID=UPI001DDD9FC4|nr:PAS domain-containing protein [Pantanalinema sp. GBBB05]
MHSDLGKHPSTSSGYLSREHLQSALIFAQSIVETVREPLIVLDTNLQVQTANRAFYRTFQVDPEETKQQFFYALGNGQWNIPALQTLLETALSHNIAFEDFEVEHEFQHIGRKTMLLNARQITQAELQTGMILLAIEDITERKQTEKALKLFNAKLEQSNRELQDFASVASHDLQEPLRKIQAFGDLLNKEYGQCLPETGQQYLQRMQNAAARMQTLINDLLAFSRVTTKAQPFIPVQLNQVVQEVLSDLEIQLQAVGGQVKVDRLPTIDADPLQMRQLLQNLISNALKFHQPHLPPVITIQAGIVAQPSTTADMAAAPQACQILIEDNGIGFEEKYLDRIFTVFQRLHYRNEYEGTGVGLAICRKIAERHGGSITAKSSPGNGSTFIVILPVHQSDTSLTRG